MEPLNDTRESLRLCGEHSLVVLAQIRSVLLEQQQRRTYDARRPGDRRGYPRIEVSWPVRLQLGHDALFGHVVDASAGGFCVATTPTTGMQPGATYRVEVLVDGPDRTAFMAEARHVGRDRVGLAITRVLSLGE